MASTGLNSAQCRNHAAFASTFWHHFEASMVVFGISAFLIPGLVHLLGRVDDTPNRIFQRQPPTDHGTSNSGLSTDRNAAPIGVHHSSDKSTLPRPRHTRLVRWVYSTVLLGLAAFLLTLQVLIARFIGYCLHRPGHTSELVFVCILATIGAIVVALGLMTWFVSTAVLVNHSISWCLKIKRRATKGTREPALSDIRDTRLSRELQ